MNRIENFKIDIATTENCNLRCKYCYVNQDSKDMTIDTINHFYNTNFTKLKKLYNFNSYTVDFFGGEPLLNFNFIKYLVPILKKDSSCNGIGIVTNGLLLDDNKLNYIHKNNINISFSFDGLGNKITRLDTNGNSTYEQYLNHTVLRKELNSCKVMISPDNMYLMEDMLIDFVENFKLYCPDFSIVRDNIWDKEHIEKFKIYIKKLADRWIYYINKGIPLKGSFLTLYLKDSLLYYKYNYKREYCCFAGYNGCVLMPNGDIYGCMRFGTNKKLPIIQNDEININNYKIFNSLELNTHNYEKCIKCKLYNYCNMGCKYSQLENNNQPIDSVCELYKIIFDTSLYIHNKLKNNRLWLDSLKI